MRLRHPLRERKACVAHPGMFCFLFISLRWTPTNGIGRLIRGKKSTPNDEPLTAEGTPFFLGEMKYQTRTGRTHTLGGLSGVIFALSQANITREEETVDSSADRVSFRRQYLEGRSVRLWDSRTKRTTSTLQWGVKLRPNRSSRRCSLFKRGRRKLGRIVREPHRLCTTLCTRSSVGE